MSKYDKILAVMIADELEAAVKQERKRIMRELQDAHLIEWHHDRYCIMCDKTKTNAWATGCVMNPVTDIINNRKGEQK